MSRLRWSPGFARRAVAFLAGAAVLSLTGYAAKTFTFETRWRDREIAVDGKNEDWRGRLGFLKNPPALVGFLNDESDLYICFTTTDPFLKTRLLRQGVTVWIDPTGGKRKTLGIKLAPVFGSADEAGHPSRPGAAGEGEERQAPPERMAPPEDADPPAGLSVKLPGQKEWVSVPEGETKGLEVRIEGAEGLVVFEMKIPLVASEGRPYAAAAVAGKPLGVGFETQKPESPAGRKDGPGGRAEGPGGEFGGRPGGGGRGGFGGLPPGGMGGGMGGGMSPGQGPEGSSRLAEELKLWIEVKLAAKPS